MSPLRHILIVLLLLFCYDLSAQDPFYSAGSPKRKTKQRYKSKRNRKMAVICPTMQLSEYPYQSLGFKLGDPFAITYKIYLARNLAVVVDGGRSAQGLYQNYYEERFSSYPEFDTLSYSNHDITRNFVLQSRLLFQAAGPKSIKGLDWYVGIGWQWRFTTVDYEYQYEPIPNFPEVGFNSVGAQPMGPEATIGVEYAYFDLPIAAFFELQYFQSVNVEQSMNRIMGGAGLRYIF